MPFQEEPQSMDLTDEQWEVLELLVPDQKSVEADPGESQAMSSTAFCGYPAPERPERISSNVIHPTSGISR
jgi:hypothetical protein